MRHFLVSAAPVCAVAFLAGCATPPPEPPPPPPIYMTSGASSAEITANVVGTAANEGDRPMLDAFVLAVRNEMQSRGYWLDADDPDVLVELGVSSEEIDRSVKNVTLVGSFSIKATMPVRHNLTIGSETFKVQSEQSLGEEAARADLVRLAMPRAKRWIGSNAGPMDTGLAATIVHIVGGDLDPSEDSRVLADFVRAAHDTDGTLQVRELQRDADARSYKYRVVYAKGKFPPPVGFLGRVLAAHPELPLTPVP